jgi:hypothetical protein
MKSDEGPNATQPAVPARVELEQPTPAIFRLKPRFIASTCTTAPIA